MVELANSHTVRIMGLGMFKVQLVNEPCPTREEHTPRYIKGVKVKFTPESDLVRSDVTFRELPLNTVRGQRGVCVEKD